MCGGFGEVEIRDHGFDPQMELQDLNKIYAFVCPLLQAGQTACMRGLRAKEEPFWEFVHGIKA